MKEQRFPPGWDEKRVQEVLAHYENQTEDEGFAEIEAASKVIGVGMNDPKEAEELTERQQRVVAEIQRIAKMLRVDRLSSNEFDKHHKLGGLSTAGYQFGSWNRAVKAVGLQPYDIGMSNVGPKLTDVELLEEIIRLHRELGKKPSDREMARFGKYSPKPYIKRWGTWTAARDAAYKRFGDPFDGSRT